jgi:hypothetical protein
MHSVTIALIAFACVFGGSLLGLWLGSRLPEHHVDRRTQDLVKLGMGTIATLMALVLGLLVSTAKASFDTTANETKEFGAKLVLLDHVLARYGPETATARRLLGQYLALKIDGLWPTTPGQAVAPPSQAAVLFDDALERVVSLEPQSDVQKALYTRALKLAAELGQTRLLIMERSVGSSIPGLFLAILVFWATILFASFGLFAPRHATAIAVLFVSAISIAAALLLILEMAHPFSGIIHIPRAPAQTALEQMR